MAHWLPASAALAPVGRSQRPARVRAGERPAVEQAIWDLLLAHHAIRDLIPYQRPRCGHRQWLAASLIAWCIL